MSPKIVYNRCVNPFKKTNHGKGLALRNISKSNESKFPGITKEGLKICNICRKEVDALPQVTESSKDVAEEEVVEEVEDLLEGHISDIDSDSSTVPKKKLRFECSDEYHQAGVEVLTQIKDKFKNSTSKTEKILLLTLAPKSWGYRKLVKEFNASSKQAKKAKKLVRDNGILSTPNPKAGNSLPVEVQNLVRDFYQDDENSRLMPGMKDCVSVKQVDGSRVSVQKRLLLGNLSELYQLFKKKNENVKVGFSKFCQLRPSYCVLAGSSGTHTVCVCVHHENVKLMIDGAALKNLTRETEEPITTYHDCLKLITCNNPTPECYLNECEKCPGEEKIAEKLTSLFDENEIEKIEFQVWQNTDRTTLKTEIMNNGEFIQEFCGRLLKLKPHDFVARKQSTFLKDLKENLLLGHFLIQFDYAENFAFVAQNSAQAFYWNNDQASLFTVVIYYEENGQLKHKSMVIISNNLTHDTISVYQCQQLIISYLQESFEPTKIIYFSDGAPQHFKNKNSFINLRYHEEDFGISAEWHFHVTAHGKGPCDGLGGNLKRQAARASLQRKSNEQILSAEALFEWADKNLPETEIRFIPKEDFINTGDRLKTRFNKAVTIPGTQQYHSFIPISKDHIIMRKYSSANEFVIFPKTRQPRKKSQRGKKAA